MLTTLSPTTKQQITEAALAAGIVFILSALWWVCYVHPREEFLLRVATCTGGDHSRAAWNACVAKVQP